MEPKFKCGYRVEILSRKEGRPDEWENANLGKEAIIIKSDTHVENLGLNINTTKPFYKLLILDEDDRAHADWWYEEDFLQLICSNEEKGIKILERYGA